MKDSEEGLTNYLNRLNGIKTGLIARGIWAKGQNYSYVKWLISQIENIERRLAKVCDKHLRKDWQREGF